MRLIVGLGNPGRIYAASKHNIGFSLVKSFAKKHKITLKNDTSTCSLNGKGKIEGSNVVVAMPLTFMNVSGQAVRFLVKKYAVDLKDLLVVCDDLDLELGRLRIKGSGSSAGHRGLESIIERLGTGGFSRLRIGVGRPLKKNIEPAEYVLSGFTREQRQRIKESLERALACCEVWFTQGLGKSMNIFNRRSNEDTTYGMSRHINK